MVKTLPDFSTQARLADRMRPIQQQIVVIEHVVQLLLSDVRVKELFQFGFPQDEPGERILEHIAQRRATVYRAGIDCETTSLGWKAILRLAQAKLVPHHAEQIFRIPSIVNGEGVVQSNAFGVLA